MIKGGIGEGFVARASAGVFVQSLCLCGFVSASCRGDCSVLSMVEVALVSEVKSQWKRLWKECIDDPVRAEGVASMDFDKLFVERGTIVLATRQFKPLILREILEQHRTANAERHVFEDKQVGGWRKFARTSLPKYVSARQRRDLEFVEVKKPQQLRKGGRGWLHM